MTNPLLNAWFWLQAKIARKRKPEENGSYLAPPSDSYTTMDMTRILRPQAAYRWILPQLSAITPTYIESTLRGALSGSHLQMWELFDLMEDTWPRLAKNLNALKRSIVQRDPKFYEYQESDDEPSATATEKKRLVQHVLMNMTPDPALDENGLHGTIFDILDGWAKGHVVLETSWESRAVPKIGQVMAPRATWWVHPVCYAWDMYGRLGLRTELGIYRNGRQNGLRVPYGAQDDPRSPVSPVPGVWQYTAFQPRPTDVDQFPEHKFLIGINKQKSGTAMGAALLRPLAWWWCAANFSADYMMNLAQIFGIPFRWATYQTGTSQETINRICSMLENMGSATWGAFPAGTTLEVKDLTRQAGASPQADLTDRADRNCDLLILGQTLTSEQGDRGSQALGTVHMEVRDELVQAAAEYVENVINGQLIPSICILNYGNDDECPSIRLEAKQIHNALDNANRDKVLIDAGLGKHMGVDWLLKRHDIPKPKEGEETLSDDTDSPDASAEADGPEPGAGGGDNTKRKLGALGARASGASMAADHSDLFLRAVAADLAPLRQRLSAIAAIDDLDLFEDKLQRLLEELPALQKNISADPETARALRAIMGTAMANGLLQKRPTA